MKKSLLSVVAVLATLIASAQNPTAYFMEGSTFRSQFNPAFAPLRGYVNIPGLGGVQAGVSGNMSLDKFLYPRDGKLLTIFDTSITAGEALVNLKPNNLLGTDVRVNLIGFGAFTRNHKNFWSFDLNVRENSDIDLPYAFFEFIKRGQDGKIRNMGATVESFIEAGFNYSFPLLDDKLYIGVRGKFLVGAARARLHYNRFDVTMNEEHWLVDAEGQFDLTMGGAKVTTTVDDAGNPSYNFDDLSFKPNASPAGYGFAVDLGATYQILPALQASLAVTDLGFISWGKKNTITGASVSHMEFAGATVTGDGTTSPDFSFDALKFTPEQAVGTTRMMRATINAGLEYEVWRHKIGIGLLYSARILHYKTRHNITGSVNFHPVRWFTVTGSYSVLDNRGGAVGLGLNLNTNWINFFVATDILTAKYTPQFIPIRQSTMNVTLGLGIPIGPRSHRIAAYVKDCERH